MPSLLLTCPACAGLSPAAHAVCLHCDAPLTSPGFGRLARALGRLVLGTGALVTLMACYGMTARPGAMAGGDCGGDADGDLVCAPRDCDDTRPDIYPGAADPDLDGVDQNCDGLDGWRDPATVAVPPPAPAEPPRAPATIATDPP